MSRKRRRHTPSTPAGRKLANLAEREIQVTKDPWPAIAARLRRSRQGTSTQASWSGPALDVAARRRIADSAAEHKAAAVRGTPDRSLLQPEAIPRHTRSGSSNALQVAVIIAFGIISIVLALALRGTDEQGDTLDIATNPTATATAIRQPTPAVQVYRDREGNTVEVSVWVSDPAPPSESEVALSGRILVNGQPVAGVLMRSWLYRPDTAVSCSAMTGADGVATCLLNSGPTKGGSVDAPIEFLYRGQPFGSSTSFTTQP
jgi:hypothetical protein